MKTDHKIKAEPGSEKLKTEKKPRNSRVKSTSGTNGKRPLATYEHAPIGIVECSPDGNHINANEEFCRFLGYEKEELLRKSLKEITHEDDYPIDIKLHQQLVEGKIPFYRLEKRYIHQNGRSLWAELTRSVIRDVSGNPLYTIGVVLDISDRKDVERVLRDSSERLRLATQAARMFMWELDVRSRVYTFADNFEAVLGFGAELLPKNSIEAVERLMPPEDVQAFWDGFAKAAANHGDLHSMQLRLINPENQEVIWLEANAKIVYNDDGSAERMFGVAQNITQNKRADEKLRQQSEILEWAHVVIRDLDSHIISWNKGVEKLYGWTKEEALGKASHELFQTKFPVSLEDTQEKLLANGEWEGELEHLKRGGTPLIVLSHQVIHRDATGKPVAVLEDNTDITERRRAERALKEFARQQQGLYQLTDQLHRTNSLEDVFNAALDAILSSLQCDRASILLSDKDGIMRFVAWRGLSDRYRTATDGHSPWKSDEKNPEPVCMNDVRTADLSDSLRAVINSEEIGALAFIPLVSNGKLIGKFMTYYNTPHVFSEDEVEFSLTIARQLAFGVDRKRVEAALARERELLERLFNTMPVMVSIYDPTTNKPQFNAQFEKVIGWKPEEVTLLSLMESCYPDPDYRKQVAQTLGSSAEGEWIDIQMRTRDDRKLDTTWSNMRFTNGMNVGLGIDITERKRAEERLRQAVAFDEAVMSNMGEGLYTVDSEGRVTSMNPAAEKIFGWTFEEIHGHKMHDVTHYKYPDGTPFPAEDCAVLQVLHHGQKLVHHEDIFIHKDGRFFDVICSSSPIWDNGRINGLVVVFSNNTMRKQAEKRLVLLSEISELVRKAEDPSELLYAVSEAVGDHFQARRCLFNEIDTEKDIEVVHRDYCRGVESVAGVHKVSDYSSLTSAEMESGKTVVNHDSKLDPRTAPDYERSYVQHGERAYVTIPLMRENHWVASLWISDDMPRQWSEEDVSLLETIAERTWVAVEKLRIDAALRASESLYRTIARSIPGGGVYVVDKDMRYIVADGAVTEAFGLSREMLEGQKVSEVFRDEQRSRMIERLQRNFAGETVSYETEHNGRVYWTQQAPLLESIGQAIIVTLDITERKQMEEALRQSEERFAQFMQHLPGLAWIKDTQGRYVYANAAAETAFNTPLEKLYSRTDEDIFPLEIAAQFKKNDGLALLDEKGIQAIETLEHNDGILRYSLVNKFPIPGPDGNIALIGGTAFDITERKQAEEALRESEERYRTLFESIDEGFCIIEKVQDDVSEKLDFLYVEANPAFAAQAGVGGVMGKTIRQAFPGEPEEWFETYDHILRTGEPMKFERGLVTQGRVLELYAFRVEDGTNRRVAVVFNDITERKQAEEALQALNLQLETRVVMRTAELQESQRRLQILSQRLVEVQEEERRAIARELHDRVGQSLSALNINLIIMRNQLLPDSLERVASRFDDSMHLVGETITLVRDVMSNLRPAVLDDYGLEAALQSYVDEYRSRYEIKVVLEKSAQPILRLGPSIEMTFLRIAQEALMNIARHANASQVTLSLWQEGDSICMTIQDNGTGIVSWQEANRPGSHGLTIMRERAEAFGGNLKVSSVPGQGTRVEMSIPIRKGNQNEVEKEILE